MRRRAPMLLAVLTAMPLVGCGGEDSEGPVAEVAIESFQYLPGDLEIGSGTTVVWSNRDDFAHTVTAGTPTEPATAFQEGVLGDLGQMNAAGQRYVHTFEDPGTFAYFCRFHPRQMRATVTVTP